jgi:hypothetical protein
MFPTSGHITSSKGQVRTFTTPCLFDGTPTVTAAPALYAANHDVRPAQGRCSHCYLLGLPRHVCGTRPRFQPDSRGIFPPLTVMAVSGPWFAANTLNIRCVSLALLESNVRFGSLADIGEGCQGCPLYPRSGHAHRRHQCLLCARSRDFSLADRSSSIYAGPDHIALFVRRKTRRGAMPPALPTFAFA